MDFVLHKHRAEDADGEIAVQQQATRSSTRNVRHKSHRDVVPVETKTPCGNSERDHEQTGQTEYTLDPIEFQKPDHRGDGDGRHRQRDAIAPSQQQLKHQGDCAQFGSAGDEVLEIRSDECENPDLLRKAFPNG